MLSTPAVLLPTDLQRNTLKLHTYIVQIAWAVPWKISNPFSSQIQVWFQHKYSSEWVLSANWQHWAVPDMWADKYKTKMVRNPIRKMKTIWTDKLEVANWQTGGGAKSGPALTWIDLRKLCQGKCLRWHPAKFKKVCKYGATMHIGGSRSLWRKIIRSGGLRSPNPLRSMGWGTWLPLTRLSKNREVTCYYAVRCVRCRCKGNHLLNLLNFTVNLKVTGDL